MWIKTHLSRITSADVTNSRYHTHNVPQGKRVSLHTYPAPHQLTWQIHDDRHMTFYKERVWISTPWHAFAWCRLVVISLPRTLSSDVKNSCDQTHDVHHGESVNRHTLTHVRFVSTSAATTPFPFHVELPIHMNAQIELFVKYAVSMLPNIVNVVYIITYNLTLYPRYWRHL